MTHEPECQSFDGGHICICDVIKPAYQRGREDAADTVNVAIGNNGPLFDQAKQSDVMAWWDKTVAAARGDVADKTDKNTGGHGGLVSRENVSLSSVATTYNIDDPEAVVNVIRAAVVNVRQASNVNVRGDGGV